jgi:hypothetical protein
VKQAASCAKCGARGTGGGTLVPSMKAGGWVCRNKAACTERMMDRAFTQKDGGR